MCTDQKRRKKTNTSNKRCKNWWDGVMGKRDPDRIRGVCAYFEFDIRVKYFIIMCSATAKMVQTLQLAMGIKITE